MTKNSFSQRACALALCLLLLMPISGLAQETQEVPNVTEILKTHTKLDLSEYQGKTVFLNFFTEWCVYCMQEMPDLKKLRDTYSEDELAIVLVHVWDGENADNTQSVKDRFDMHDMTFFEDEDMMVAAVTGIPGYPASLFVNPDGTLEAAAAYKLEWDMLTAQLDKMGVAPMEVQP